MLTDEARRLAEAKVFAALSTHMADGSIQTHPMWVDTDGEHIVVNTEIHRPKFANMQRDPRVTVLLIDPDDPYAFVEVRGRAVEFVRGPEARAHIDRLSHKYLGRDYPGTIESERVIVRIAPDRVVVRPPR